MTNNSGSSETSALIGELDTRRREVGADTPAGWILSNAIEQLKSLQNVETEEQRAALTKFLQDTMKRLAEVLPPGNRQAGEG